MHGLIKDPLVHFLAAGAALFGILALGGGSGSEGASEAPRVEIGADAVRETLEAATILEGREPSPEELRELVEPLIREELLYREALALGLDENDDEVRRRLVEKMRYLLEDLADPEPASREALREFYDANRELFARPERVTFEHVFFDPEHRGEQLDDDVTAALASLRDGAEPATLGDSTPLRSRFTDAPRDQVRVLLGETLTEAVFAAEPGRWIGPFESDFGLHLVRLAEREPAATPPFDAVVDEAREQYAAERRAQANEQAYAELRARYEVDVDWPESLDPGAQQ